MIATVLLLLVTAYLFVLAIAGPSLPAALILSALTLAAIAGHFYQEHHG